MSRFLVLTSNGILAGSHANYFNTYEEAEAFAMKLNFNVTIYVEAAKVTIRHDVEHVGGGGNE